MKKVIITIGRQLGSNGREIGKRLAKALNIPFYDKELIAEAAKQSGLSEKLFENADEKPTNSFLYSLVMSVQPGADLYTHYNDLINNDSIFKIQSDIINGIADKGSCIIVGRCADYVLRDRAELVKVFIHAGLDTRIKRIAERDKVSEKDARNAVLKADKRRGNYYNFYTNEVWGDVKNYDIAIDSGKINLDACAELLKKYVEIK